MRSNDLAHLDIGLLAGNYRRHGRRHSGGGIGGIGDGIGGTAAAASAASAAAAHRRRHRRGGGIGGNGGIRQQRAAVAASATSALRRHRRRQWRHAQARHRQKRRHRRRHRRHRRQRRRRVSSIVASPRVHAHGPDPIAIARAALPLVWHEPQDCARAITRDPHQHLALDVAARAYQIIQSGRSHVSRRCAGRFACSARERASAHAPRSRANARSDYVGGLSGGCHCFAFLIALCRETTPRRMSGTVLDRCAARRQLPQAERGPARRRR